MPRPRLKPEALAVKAYAMQEEAAAKYAQQEADLVKTLKIRNPDGTFNILLTRYTLLSRCNQLGLSFSRRISDSAHCCNVSSSKRHLLSCQRDIPKYWIENDGTMCLDEFHRWKPADAIAWMYFQFLIVVYSFQP